MTLQKNGVKKMTAREMFEELGYTYTRRTGSSAFRYAKSNKEDELLFSIEFDTEFGTVYIHDRYGINEITMPVFKAIQQQLLELGWLLC